MAKKFSFEHYIVPKVHKFEENLMVNAVFSNFQDKCFDSPYRMMPLAGSGFKTEGNHLKIEKLTALLLHNACTSLKIGNRCHEQQQT